MWFKVDDKLHASRKARNAGVAAMGLWLLTGAWCADNGTDGFVPKSEARHRDPKLRLAQKLVDSRLWVEVEAEGEQGYQFHNWCDYQPSAQEIEQRREREKERIRASRAKAKNATSGKDLSEKWMDSGKKVYEKWMDSGKKVEASEPDNPSSEAKGGDFVAAYKIAPEPEPEPDHSSTDVELSDSSPSAQCSPAAKPADPDGFAAFWAAYPRREDRKAALRAWGKAATRADPAVIIAGAERYRDDPNREPGYTKHAATWLNNDSWGNDPLPQKLARRDERPGPGPLDMISSSGKQQLFLELKKNNPDVGKLRAYGMSEDQIRAALGERLAISG